MNFDENTGVFSCTSCGSKYKTSGAVLASSQSRGSMWRLKIVLAEDGQILVDTSRRYRYEHGEWASPDAFLR